MSKKITKALCFVMAALLTFAITPITAFAAETNGSIEVENAVEGQNYKLYQIMTLESYDTNTGAFSYKALEEWRPFLAKEGVKVDESGYIEWNDNLNTDDKLREFAKRALEFAEDPEKPITATAQKVADGATVTFDPLPLGYYLLDSSLGTICSLNTNLPDVTIKEKNPEPTLEKEVKENSTSEWGEVNDANTGETVEFRSIINATSSAVGYVFHDKMDASLIFQGADSVNVYLFNGDVPEDFENTNPIDPENYTFSEGTEKAEKCTFELKFAKNFCEQLDDNSKIVITYKATLDQSATVGTGIRNDAKLEYGDTNKSETAWDWTKTYTWDANFFKYFSEKVDGSLVQRPLEGAEFSLFNSAELSDSSMIYLLKTKDADEATGQLDTYKVVAKGTNNAVTKITTGDSGRFVIEGLDSGTYYLKEVKAPEGYNLLEEARELKIDPQVNDKKEMTLEKVNVEVENKSGLQLPSTGGIGTTIFYVGGGILVIGAIVYLVTRRRAKSSK